ncbi:MAG: TetR/AcrR family transcriptional repressor of nem operon [Alteromonadaceae bacterium]|jgi:TetR/AcrR family transcriptional repressor of nem operon
MTIDNPNDTRTMIIDVAQDMLQRQSISGVSFQSLADRIGIKKGSMYYHFKSKDELAIAILERACTDLKTSFSRGKHKTAVQQLDYFLMIYEKFIGPGQRMCPGGCFASEWQKISKPVKESVKKVLNVQINGIRDILIYGNESGEFNHHGQEIQQVASWIISSLQGSILTSRVEENQMHFDFSVQAIKRFLYRV